MMAGAESVTVHPLSTPGGEIRVPGDKSISHRVAMLAGLACGDSVVSGFLKGEDCLNTLRAMCAMGARAEEMADGRLRITGCGGRLEQPAGVLDVGNSGTSMRLLAGLAAGFPITVEMTGDASLLSRPMRRIQEPLVRMGAKVDLLGNDGRGPVRVTGGGLKGITYELPVASAQVKSCVLLAGLCAAGTTVVVEPLPTRDHTERLLGVLGCPIRVNGCRVEVDGAGPGGVSLPARDWDIPGDFSSAAYFAAIGALSPGQAVTIRHVGLNPRRTALLDVLRRMGAEVSVTRSDDDGEPAGDLVVRGARLKGTEVGGAEIPSLIDELPLVAVLAARADGETVIRDAGELRVKESDRIAVMVKNLRKMGVDAAEMESGMVVRGKSSVRGGVAVDSFGDHRIAMSMCVLGLFSEKPVRVLNTACVATSYPEFWDHLRSTGAHVE